MYWYIMYIYLCLYSSWGIYMKLETVFVSVFLVARRMPGFRKQNQNKTPIPNATLP